MIPAQRERHALADLLDEVGPEAPTLCEGWRARDLAAHLVLRERRPDASAGIVLPLLSRYTSRIQGSIRDGQPWDRLVERIRSGPPLPFSLPGVNAAANTVEYFVHHEDVRRATGDADPRALDEETEAAVWGRFGLVARLLARSVPVGVRLEPSSRRALTLKAGKRTVAVRGPAGELVLWAFGRQGVARVELDGDAKDVERLRGARLGL